jgi:hypothetical protein
MRMVIDYRPLNDRTRRDSHPMPHSKDVLVKVGKYNTYNKSDMLNGFYQILIEELSRYCTAAITPETLFSWLRMPFGVRNGPPCF